MWKKARKKGFTLIELLVVVAIISILSAIAIVNMRQATERSLLAADASNLHTLVTALQIYLSDYSTLPPADREAGPFMSHTREFYTPGNGPAAGGSWDGVPWLLVEYGYIQNWKVLFCPKYLRRYNSGETIRGKHVRYHNFRYAYNSSALSTGGHIGGDGNIMSGEVWILRDLFLGPEQGWYAADYPKPPADFNYPWGEGDWENKLELAVFSDFAVRTVLGGQDHDPRF